MNNNKFTGIINMKDFIIPSIYFLQTMFKSAFQTMLDDYTKIHNIKFVVFIFVLILMFIFIWQPYVRALSEKIWRTKGMLNMIPMSVIIKNDKLRQTFTKGEILKAVK